MSAIYFLAVNDNAENDNTVHDKDRLNYLWMRLSEHESDMCRHFDLSNF